MTTFDHFLDWLVDLLRLGCYRGAADTVFAYISIAVFLGPSSVTSFFDYAIFFTV